MPDDSIVKDPPVFRQDYARLYALRIIIIFTWPRGSLDSDTSTGRVVEVSFVEYASGVKEECIPGRGGPLLDYRPSSGGK